MPETKKYTCKCKNKIHGLICNRKFGENEYRITNDKDKCIFHCKKDIEYTWIFSEINSENNYYEYAKGKWNSGSVSYFWKEFNIYLNGKDEDIIIYDFIFPIYWIYQYNHESILESLKDKTVRFFNCVFLDYIFIESKHYEIKNSIKRISFTNGCLFNREIKFNNIIFENGCTILNSEFKEDLVFTSCNFKYLFEVVNSHLNNIYLINIKAECPVEINYNRDIIFNLNIRQGNIQSLKILDNKISKLSFENIDIGTINIDSKHPDLENYYLTEIVISENSEINRLILENMKVDGYSIIDSNIEEKSLMKKSKFTRTLFNNTKFSGITDFSEAEFSENVSFKLCSFDEVIFRDSKFFKELDLCDISFYKNKTFLGIKANMANRETARIIKDSFEKENNIIEANKFYALEMKEREEELKWGKDFFEKLIFSIHGWSSNHSQDWLLALFWILNITFITSFVGRTINKSALEVHFIDRTLFLVLSIIITGIILFNIRKYIGNWSLFLISGFMYWIHIKLTGNYSLDNIANCINPFSVMNNWDNITFNELIFKIIIAYLIYQLIISIRQNTRRK
ncbi:pentapeptide repeat-containing protein [Arcobacter sp.]|uniref:pentapeptide repeat-containing protein n=1 Tax=Arcobacter sp. TaxID=1872629 RepID=UPI003D12819F